MARQKNEKEKKVREFRLELSNHQTHKLLWSIRFNTTNLIVGAITTCVVACAMIYAVFAFTPLKTTLPGYPDASTKREILRNAIKVDSLERIVSRWEFYSENLARVMSGRPPMRIDSLLQAYNIQGASPSSEELAKRDSLLRKEVVKEEQFELSYREVRKMPIEGMHFFTPLKGVISQEYDKVFHPYIDITAPANSVVMAVLDGTVIFAGWSDEAGYTMQIQHENDIVSIYKHNSKLLKKAGEKVTAGSPVAVIGGTGSQSTGDHLHFELWYRGEAVNPVNYINF